MKEHCTVMMWDKPIRKADILVCPTVDEAKAESLRLFKPMTEEEHKLNKEIIDIKFAITLLGWAVMFSFVMIVALWLRQ